jgi:hypothetical protein
MGQGWGNNSSSSTSGVQSVSGLNTDNTDPTNPIVQISVDGTTITGAGTPASPLQSNYNPTTNFGLYAQTSISATIVNSDVETSIIGTGVGTLSVPANSFLVGGSFVAKMGGEITNLNGTKITFKVKSLGIILVDTGLISIKSSTNQFWQLEINFTIRQIGGVGVASLISNGTFSHIRNNTSLDIFGFNTINNTDFDTTSINTLDITAEWETANIGNSIHSDYFVLNKIY